MTLNGVEVGRSARFDRCGLTTPVALCAELGRRDLTSEIVGRRVRVEYGSLSAFVSVIDDEVEVVASYLGRRPRRWIVLPRNLSAASVALFVELALCRLCDEPQASQLAEIRSRYRLLMRRCQAEGADGHEQRVIAYRCWCSAQHIGLPYEGFADSFFVRNLSVDYSHFTMR
jgi:hypothetical protein